MSKVKARAKLPNSVTSRGLMPKAKTTDYEVGSQITWVKWAEEKKGFKIKGIIKKIAQGGQNRFCIVEEKNGENVGFNLPSKLEALFTDCEIAEGYILELIFKGKGELLAEGYSPPYEFEVDYNAPKPVVKKKTKKQSNRRLKKIAKK